QGDGFYRLNGAGEMLVFSAADFEDFLEPRPDLPPSLESELEAVVRHLVEKRWPFRLHATYEESITRFLDVVERVNRDLSFAGLRWFFDHAETISERSMERTRALGGGIAVQDRMAFQGESFAARYGKDKAAHSPPLRRMLELGIPVGAGTDATRVASFNPWISLHWLVSGKTVGGTALYGEANRLARGEALRVTGGGGAWLGGEENERGATAGGHSAVLWVPAAASSAVPERETARLGPPPPGGGGAVVPGGGPSAAWAPPLPPVSPSWSP